MCYSAATGRIEINSSAWRLAPGPGFNRGFANAQQQIMAACVHTHVHDIATFKFVCAVVCTMRSRTCTSTGAHACETGMHNWRLQVLLRPAEHANAAHERCNGCLELERGHGLSVSAHLLPDLFPFRLHTCLDPGGPMLDTTSSFSSSH